MPKQKKSEDEINLDIAGNFSGKAVEKMPGRQKPNSISVNVSGDVSGQIVVGNNNRVIKAVRKGSVTSQELEQLNQLLSDLKSQVQAQAPEDKRNAALERVGELQQAVMEDKPDISTMEYVKNWFGKHLPGLAGTVVGVLVHPVVGKLVEAAGDVVADEFKNVFPNFP